MPSFDYGHDGRRKAARRFGIGAICAPAAISPSMRLFNRPVQRRDLGHYGDFLWVLLTATRQVAAAIRLWRRNARSRRELRELSDSMLKDIGLRREDVGYGFGKGPRLLID
jgi:uncharacterized protein YjiS (DUF1127 family)